MSTRPADLLALAQHLIRIAPQAPSGGDAIWRCVVGRCYYSAFLTVRGYLERSSASPKRDAHRFVREQILALAPKLPPSAPASAHELISGALATLIGMRLKADCDLNVTVTQDDARLAVAEASNVLQWVRQLP